MLFELWKSLKLWFLKLRLESSTVVVTSQILTKWSPYWMLSINLWPTFCRWRSDHHNLAGDTVGCNGVRINPKVVLHVWAGILPDEERIRHFNSLIKRLPLLSVRGPLYDVVIQGHVGVRRQPVDADDRPFDSGRHISGGWRSSTYIQKHADSNKNSIQIKIVLFVYSLLCTEILISFSLTKDQLNIALIVALWKYALQEKVPECFQLIFPLCCLIFSPIFLVMIG